MYALAAGAAGVSLLALAPLSEAEIIYTKAYHVIPKGGHYNLDLNHDGKTDFSFVDRFNCTEDFCPNALSVNPTGENGVEGRQGFLEKWAYALPQGAHIGPRHPFSGQVILVRGSTSPTAILGLSSRFVEQRTMVGRGSMLALPGGSLSAL
jgi:hypothetical protein